MLFRSLLLAFAGLLVVAAPAVAQTRKHPPVASAARAPNWLNVIVRTPEGGVRQGNPAAKVKLVEYGSRTCPVCGRFYNEGFAPLRANYVATGKVSYEFREFWVHPQDPGVSLIGQCVPTAGFFRVLDAMYTDQQTFNARLTDAVYNQIQALPRGQQPAAYARKLGYVPLMTKHGVPLAQVNKCLGDMALLNHILELVKQGAKLGVEGTPSFFINGQKANAVTWGDLEPLLKSSGA